MADYIYLLESRLSLAQQQAILAVRELARAKGLTVFLVGGAVRDLTSGSPVRDLDLVVQGNALKLKKDLEKTGAVISGEYDAEQELFARFPGGVRMAIGSTLSVTYPKPGKPVFKPATILEDLRRRDFTANAMALSLNQGSYGLLMDPLNGVADIENRELRLVSNYGFIESPIRMVRAQRYAARLGWQLEEKTQTRYETGKAEGYISALQEFHRGYEAEEIVHEEDPLRVMRRLESEGWMKVLDPAWSSAKANVAELEKLREAQMQLQMQGIHADPSAAQFPLLTAKLGPKDVAALKNSFPREGFVGEIEALEADAKRLAAELTSKQAATPSATWKMITAARPEVVLWVAYSTKNSGLQAKFKSFYTEWPMARQRIPYTLMQEMRIVPDLPGFDSLVEQLVFELMDGKLGTPEEMKAYLEPFSPPAPPPPVNLRRARATKKDAKPKKRKKSEEAVEALEGGELEAASAEALTPEALAEMSGGEVDPDGSAAPSSEPKASAAHKPAVPLVKPAKAVLPVKTAAPVKAAPPQKAVPGKTAPKPPAKAAPAKKLPLKPVPAKKVVVPAKPVAKNVSAKKAIAPKAAAKKAVPAKLAAKKAPAPKKAVKSVVKKAATKAPAKAVAAKRVTAKKTATKAPAKAATKVAAKSAKPNPPAKKKR